MTRPRAARAALAAALGAGLLAACVGGGAAQAPPAPPAPVSAQGFSLVVTLDGLAADRRARAEALAERVGATLEAVWPLAAIGRDCIVLRPLPGREEETARALAADPEVRSVQPMGRFAVSSSTAPDPDAVARAQPSLAALNAPRAHTVATGAGVTVALIDTGVDPDHPELRGALAERRDFVEDGAPGAERHGTALAGVIAARGRLRGVAFDARLAALRACWEEAGAERGACSTASLARALNYAALAGADVINLSVSGPPDPLLAELIDAADARGAIVVAAADPRGEGFPASHPAVLAARPSEAPDSPARAIPAPGADVLAPIPAGGYDFMSGSSVAAAHLSGVAALLRGVRPAASGPAARAALAAAVSGRGPTRSVDACLAVATPAYCEPSAKK